MASETRLTPFQQALLDSVLEEYADLPSEEALPAPFSESFTAWSTAFLARTRRKRLHIITVTKRVLIAAIIVMLLAGAAMSIPVIREAIIDFFVHEDDVKMGITFDPDEAEGAPEKIEHPYEIAYVPSGYRVVADNVAPALVSQWWTNNMNQWIIFMQYSMPHTAENLNWWMSDAEKCQRQRILLGDYLVEAIETEDNYKLVWTNNEYVFTLELPYSITEEEMQAIFASWGPRDHAS